MKASQRKKELAKKIGALDVTEHAKSSMRSIPKGLRRK
jgi:hypothetical protein